MSGGSYNYLYIWASDPQQLVSRRADLEAMADRLAELPYAKDAAQETKEILALIDQVGDQIAARGRVIADVWHAVEWWDSADYGEDKVREALAAYLDARAS